MSYTQNRRRDRIEQAIFYAAICLMLLIFINYGSSCFIGSENSSPHSLQQVSEQNRSHGVWAELIGHPFDAAIAVFTMLLAIFTYQLVSDAKDNSERQLRAYLFIDKASIKEIESPSPFLKVTIKNSGQTPAYKIKADISLVLQNSDGEGFSPVKEIQAYEGITLPPHECLKVSINLEDIDHLHADIKSGKINIRAFGKLSYMDAFNIPRFTNFNLITDDIAAGDCQLGYETTGNDST